MLRSEAGTPSGIAVSDHRPPTPNNMGNDDHEVNSLRDRAARRGGYVFPPGFMFAGEVFVPGESDE